MLRNVFFEVVLRASPGGRGDPDDARAPNAVRAHATDKKVTRRRIHCLRCCSRQSMNWRNKAFRCASFMGVVRTSRLI